MDDVEKMNLEEDFTPRDYQVYEFDFHINIFLLITFY